jgi:RHS repeat-associated protein
LSEAYSGGPLGGLTVSNVYDGLLRRTTCGLWNGSAWLAQTHYAYDAASGRLLSVSDDTNSATYSYLAHSPLVEQIAFTNNGQWRMTTTKSYDGFNRLTEIRTQNSELETLNSFAYAYNAANQRTRADVGGTSSESPTYWLYTYDSLGQVISGKKYWTDGTPVAGQQFEYAFDDIGNRKSAASGGDQWGVNLRYENYSVNLLNQHISRTVPGYVNVLGAANPSATVTVNNQPSYRKGEYFRAELPFDNSAGALYPSVTNLAVLQNGTNADIVTNRTGNVLLPKTPETFTFDADGNLTSDGRRVFFYDDENQLTTVLVSNAWKSEFTYDGRMRRRVRKEYAWQGTAWLLTHEVRYVYDGNLVLQERDASNLPLVTYTRGLDLSGSLEGAGGIGGLLARTVNTLLQAPGSALLAHAYYHADGNGNITCLLNSTQQVAARYLYGPFGDTLSASGLLADANTYRFSSQDFHRTSGLIHFLRRFYEPAMQRWITQDPLDMSAGPNLYLYTANTPINAIDPRGQQVVPVRQWDPTRGIWIEVMPPTIVYGDGPIIVGWWGSGDRFVPGARQDTRPNGASREPGTGQGERPKARLVDCRTAGGSQHLVHPNLAVAQAMQDLAGGLAEVIGGFIPYVGDMLDARDVVSPSSSALDRSLGGASLTLNAATAGVLPNYGPIRRGIGRIVSGLTGQNHHAISMTIWRALDQHPGTSGHFVPRDGRFVTQAADLASHNGYDTWHRTYDNNVAQSILAQAELTPEQFTQYLRELYKTDPELCRRFPNGL